MVRPIRSRMRTCVGGSQRSRVAASVKTPVSTYAAVHTPTAASTPRPSPTTTISIPASVSSGGRIWITFQRRTRARPSRIPERHAPIMFGKSAGAAIAASRRPNA